jgi:hypothetical protein
MLSLPRCDLLTHWLQALPRSTPPYTRGGLQNVHISGGPTRGRFIAWIDKPHDDTARFCFELEWNMYPHAPEEVRENALTSAFHYLSALRGELNAVGVRLNITSESVLSEIFSGSHRLPSDGPFIGCEKTGGKYKYIQIMMKIQSSVRRGARSCKNSRGSAHFSYIHTQHLMTSYQLAESIFEDQ